MSQFIVYDNGKQCKYPDHKVSPTWDNAMFPTLEEAVVYARHWLGEYEGTIPSDWNGDPIDYSGGGDTIEIRTV